MKSDRMLFGMEKKNRLIRMIQLPVMTAAWVIYRFDAGLTVWQGIAVSVLTLGLGWLLWHGKTKKMSVGAFWFLGVLSALFGVCSIIGYGVDREIPWIKSFQVHTVVMAIGMALTFFHVSCVAAWYISLPSRSEKALPKIARIFKEKPFLVSAIGIAVAWLPYWLIFFPCSLSNDAINQIEQTIGVYYLSSHHPPFSTFLMGGCFNFGRFWGSDLFGLWLYTVFQYFAMAFAFAWIIDRCIKRWNCSVSFGFVVMLYFALLPVWPSFAQFLVKDGVYTVSVVLFMVELIEAVISRRQNWGRLTVTGLLMSLLRNNGVYIALAVLISGCIVLRKRQRKYMVISMAAVIVMMQIYSSVVLPAMGVMKGSSREMLSIPFQQTALYVKEHGDEVTEEEQKAINAVLDYDSLAEGYSSWISDPVKDTFKADGSLKEYFEVWVKQLFKHPETYFQAFFNASAGYYSISVNNAYFANYFYSDTSANIHHQYLFGSLESVREQILQWADDIQGVPLIHLAYQVGTYTWSAVLLLWVAFSQKKYEQLVVLSPIFISVLVCIASPVANCVRYMLPVMAVLPIAIASVAYSIKCKNCT